MSKKFSKVKMYFDNGLWGLSRVRDAVVKGWITMAEYEEITGTRYVEGEDDD